MSLLVQDFLKTHSFKDLAEMHGVYSSFSKSGHKFSLNYDQIEAKEDNPLTQECRGLILSSVNGLPFSFNEINGKRNFDHIIPGDTRILAFPMRRFFNYGQGSAANVNWNDPNLSILEKLDGTLCIVYFDVWTNQWCVATRSVSEADLPLDNGLFAFRTLFEKALLETTGSSFEEYTQKLDKEITYCFELTTPYNRVVVYYPDNKITLLAARSVIYSENWSSFEELNIKDVPTFGVPIVKGYSYSSINDLVEWVSSRNPVEYEGVVVRDSNFNRIKIKNAAYVAQSKMRDTLGSSIRNCLTIILLEKDDDVLPLLPEDIKNNLIKIKGQLQEFIKKYDNLYIMYKEQVNSKKEFAQLVLSNKDIWSAPFFNIFDGKSKNVKDFILNNKREGEWSNSFLDSILSAL